MPAGRLHEPIRATVSVQIDDSPMTEPGLSACLFLKVCDWMDKGCKVHGVKCRTLSLQPQTKEKKTVVIYCSFPARWFDGSFNLLVQYSVTSRRYPIG